MAHGKNSHADDAKNDEEVSAARASSVGGASNAPKTPFKITIAGEDDSDVESAKSDVTAAPKPEHEPASEPEADSEVENDSEDEQNIDDAPELEPVSDHDAETKPEADGEPEPEPETEPAPDDFSPADTTFPVTQPAKTSRGARFKRWFGSHKKSAITLIILVILGAIAAIPFTRYTVAGLVLKQNFKVAVVDKQTGKPVTNAQITLQGKRTLTNNKGVATLHVRVGSTALTATKQYYRSSTATVTVPILKQKTTARVMLQATGRQVPVTVLNRITGKPVENALFSVAHTQVRTDAKGSATLVLPAGDTDLKGTVTGSNFNSLDVTIKVTTTVDKANTFSIVPAGKLYFLSNASGKIDVVKTNLDGTDRQTVLAGTGNEEGGSTSLLASRDWKYLALLAKRTSGTGDAQLYLINTSNDQLTSMDSGNASFNPVGWDGDTFVYQVDRNGYTAGQPNAEALKSYNATTGKLATLDQTDAGTPQIGGSNATNTWQQSYEGAYIVGSKVVYAKGVNGSYSTAVQGKPAGIYAVNTDGTGKTTLKDYTYPTNGSSYGGPTLYLNVLAYEPNGLYFQASNNDPYVSVVDTGVYKYDDGKVSAVPGQNDVYGDADGYATYLLSPSGNATFWSEPRDGKNTLQLGDDDGANGRTVLGGTELQTYGWYTDGYLLMSKNGSELYIMGAGKTDSTTPLKVSDYYKPGLTFPGYGYGYGGL